MSMFEERDVRRVTFDQPPVPLHPDLFPGQIAVKTTDGAPVGVAICTGWNPEHIGYLATVTGHGDHWDLAFQWTETDGIEQLTLVPKAPVPAE